MHRMVNSAHRYNETKNAKKYPVQMIIDIVSQPCLVIKKFIHIIFKMFMDLEYHIQLYKLNIWRKYVVSKCSTGLNSNKDSRKVENHSLYSKLFYEKSPQSFIYFFHGNWTKGYEVFENAFPFLGQWKSPFGFFQGQCDTEF